MEDEQQNLTGYAWLSPEELTTVDGRLEPAGLGAALARLSPGGAWDR